MSSAPSQVLDLSVLQTTLLKRAVGERLRELDSFADDSLTEYVMVLLANRHPHAKIVAELEDFMSASVVESFVSWLFSKCKELKSSSSSSVSGPGDAVERRSAPRALGTTSQRILSSALRDVAASAVSPPSAAPSMMMEVEPTSSLPEGQRRDEPQDDRTRTRMQRFGRAEPARGGPGRSRSRSPFARASRSGDANGWGREPTEGSLAHRAFDRMSDRSRSPPPPSSRRRSIRYESISARQEREAHHGRKYELPAVRDARELISGRRSVRGVFESPTDASFAPASPSDTWGQRIIKPFEKEEQPTMDGGKSLATSASSPPEGNKMVRCSYWPNCKAGDACPYAHPSEPCKHFPSCMFGDKCIYIHPAIPCKFQDRCQNPHCNYQHSSPAIMLGAAAAKSHQQSFAVANNPFQPPSAILCRFHPNCKNVNCPFVHPSPTACKFGEHCQRPACPYLHPEGRVLKGKAFVNAPCRYGKACTKLDCPFQHAPSPTAASGVGGATSPLPDPANAMVMDPPSAAPGPEGTLQTAGKIHSPINDGNGLVPNAPIPGHSAVDLGAV